jgi:hypothetical protein
MRNPMRIRRLDEQERGHEAGGGTGSSIRRGSERQGITARADSQQKTHCMAAFARRKRGARRGDSETFQDLLVTVGREGEGIPMNPVAQMPTATTPENPRSVASAWR